MACKEDRYALGDRTYLIRQMPPRLAVPVEVYLAKTLGRPLFQAFADSGVDAEGAFGLAVGLFTERLDDAGLMKTMARVFQHVGILDQAIRVCEPGDETGAGLDDYFAGRNKELWQVFLKALQVNFRDFFAGNPFLSKLLKKMKEVGTTSPTPPTSTSTSGDPASPTQSSAETSTSSKTEPTPSTT